MRKILIVDTNYGFTSDIESRLILDEIDNVDISTRNKIESIHDEIENIKPDEVILFANLLTSHPTWDFGVPLRTYARDASGLSLSSEKGFQCYGIVKNAGDLISAIENNRIITIEEKTPVEGTNNITQENNNNLSQPTVESPIANESQSAQNYDTINQNVTINNPGSIQGVQGMASVQQPYGQAMPQGHSYYPGNTTPPAPQSGNINDYLKENKEAVLAALLSGQTTNGNYGNGPQQPAWGYPTGPYPNTPQQHPAWGYPTGPYPNAPQSNPYEAQTPQGYAQGFGGSQPIPGAYPQYPSGFNPTEYDVAKDIGVIKPKAKVAAVYSAKGGVGKTTLSCELATFLALTSHGRSKYRVCIIDFNIDFGNVLNTLDFNPKAVCMTHWAQNIKERLSRGERPEDIQYNQAQIESFLQHKDKDGLYALLAPLTNLDSMTIKSTEIEIMLKNIIYNGNFDYVICDTGNNTRDATYLALDYSDYVFLVLTQSVNTANSNQSFLMTMPSNFDMSKIRTVINMVKSERDSGASVTEVKESILNPITRKPFECVAEIKHLNDVQKAENVGEPLVYDAGHEFTQSIATIAKHLVGEEFVLPEMPKVNPLTELLQKIGALKK